MRAVLVGALVLVAGASCDEVETRHVDRAAAVRAGAVERNLVPASMPASARDIVTRGERAPPPGCVFTIGDIGDAQFSCCGTPTTSWCRYEGSP